jgi:hypothetical protein
LGTPIRHSMGVWGKPTGSSVNSPATTGPPPGPGGGPMTADWRTATAQALSPWGQELLAHLGGPAAVSAPHLALVEAADRTRSYIHGLDTWIAQHGTLVSARRQAVHPVVRERQHLVDGFVRLLIALGLEPRQAQPTDLSEYLRTRYPDLEGRPSGTRASSAPAPNGPRR